MRVLREVAVTPNTTARPSALAACLSGSPLASVTASAS